MPRLIHWLKQSRALTGRSITGCWLLFFYALSIWMVLGTMSAQQFQEKIRSASTEAAPISTTDVREMLENKEKMDAIDEILLQKESELQGLRADDAVQKVNEDQAEQRMLKRFEPISRHLRETGAMARARHPTVLAPMIKGAETAKGELSSAFQNYRKAWEDYELQEDVSADLNRKVEKLKAVNLDLRQDRDRIQEKQERLYARNPGMRQLMNELIYMRKLRIDFMAIMPEQMFTLLLTLAMGALGSVIFLTRMFFDPNQQHPFSWYLFRPFLGMVMAIAIFILAKAGQIIISDTGMQEGVNSNLNPFFISFLAIISGILSEQAYEKIHRSGIAFFGVEAVTPQRWGIHLQERMTEKGRTEEDLAALFSVSPQIARNWLEEQTPLPEREQELIAVWLGCGVREIFSDLPPGRIIPYTYTPPDQNDVPGAPPETHPETHHGSLDGVVKNRE